MQEKGQEKLLSEKLSLFWHVVAAKTTTSLDTSLETFSISLSLFLNHGESIFLVVRFLFDGRIVPKEKFFRWQRKMSFGRWLDWFLPAIMLWQQALPRKVDRRFFASNLI